MIDLHTHTTASDGRRTPLELVALAAAAGVTVLSITDHDTVAGCEPAARPCADARIELVPGIEITALRDGTDVHVLGYFIDLRSKPLLMFLAQQRQRRMDRARRMIDRLRECGIPLDANAILLPAIADPSRAIGRPWIARALVAAGHVTTTNEAFDRWLSRGRPAYAPREAASPEEVVSRIHDAGGVASLAHPGLLDRDSWIPAFAEAGLDSLEAYHTSHAPETTTRYLTLAGQLGIAVSGGSDYHDDESHGAVAPGSVSLPRERFDALKARQQRS